MSNINEVEKEINDFYHSDRVYYNSNEELDAIFSSFDFNRKKILSVLGSGDQAFHLINRGAKQVDLFDINKAAKYYFYLRVWMIKYLNMYYYMYEIDSDFIGYVLKHVKPSNPEEEKAYLFWNSIIKDEKLDHMIYTFFIRDSKSMRRNIIKDTDKLKSLLWKKSFSFSNIDISDNIDVSKQYDYIILSNIAEWMENDSSERIWKLTYNLYDLIKDDGKVICSRLDRSTRNQRRDKRALDIFSRMFSIYPIEGEYDNFNYSDIYKGYYLEKR